MSKSNTKLEMLNAKPVEKEVPDPLRKKSLKQQEFPVDALPGSIRKFVLAVQDRTQAPISIAAQSVLATANLATQAIADIELPHGQVRPTSCYFITIAESGERKTACDDISMQAISEYEEALDLSYKSELQAWKNQHDLWKNKRDSIIKDKDMLQNKKDAAIKNLGDEPIAPMEPILACPEPTFAGLCRLMSVSYPLMGLCCSEGGGFLHGHSMKQEDKISTAAGLCNLWDGKEVKRIRKGDPTIVLRGRRLSIHLMVQPNIGAKFLSDPDFRDQGLLSRMLVTAPQSTAGRRFYRELQNNTLNNLQEFKEIIKILLNITLKKSDLKNHKPRVIKFTQDAKELFINFSDEEELKTADNGEFFNIKGFANKIPEHAARLAAMFAIFDNHHTDEVSIKYLRSAIALVNYYAREHLRLFEEGVTDPKIALAEKLLEWLYKWPEKESEYISLPDVYQYGINAIRDKKTASEIMHILEDHGYIKRSDKPVPIKGKMRKKNIWQIIKP